MSMDIRLVALMMITSVVALISIDSVEAQTTVPELRLVDADTSEYPTVALTFDVAGNGIADGQRVTVVERGEELTGIVHAGTSGGLEVALVVDTSGSMAGAPLAAAKAALQSFVTTLPPATKVAVVAFGTQPYVVSQMTTDVAALSTGIAGLAARGETALYDALQLAADQFTPAAVPRSAILVSDGGDTASAASLEAVTARLVERKVRLFAARLTTEESNDVVLDGLAAATNGQSVAATDAADLAASYEAIAASAVRQVRVTYKSRAHGATTVEVRLTTGGSTRTAMVPLSLPAVGTFASTSDAEQRTLPAATASRSRSRTALLVGGGALFLSLLGLGLLGFRRPPKSLLAMARRSDRSVHIEGFKKQLGVAIEHTLERRGRRDALGARLELAGVALRPGEYLVMVAGAGALTAVVGFLLGGPVFGVLLGAMVLPVASLLLRSRTSKRRAALEKHLPDLLQQLTSSLRAGYGIMQALDAVAREIPAPMSEELRRVVHEVQLGRELADSLEAMADRIGGQDFTWVVQAIEINREVGGDLVEVLEAVLGTIRARAHLRRQIKTLSSQGRLSARILLAMPFVMAALISLMSPGYLEPFGRGGIGTILIVVGAMLMGTGWLWLRRIVRLDY